MGFEVMGLVGKRQGECHASCISWQSCKATWVGIMFIHEWSKSLVDYRILLPGQGQARV